MLLLSGLLNKSGLSRLWLAFTRPACARPNGTSDVIFTRVLLVQAWQNQLLWGPHTTRCAPCRRIASRRQRTASPRAFATWSGAPGLGIVAPCRARWLRTNSPGWSVHVALDSVTEMHSKPPPAWASRRASFPSSPTMLPRRLRARMSYGPILKEPACSESHHQFW